ncbi:peptidase M24 [mine drainage metagenome]|uniref:Peptidase M24 n=1 Tax=mine drainage metagenome TaxID=410659 RepID=T1A726_9ZZZZ
MDAYRYRIRSLLKEDLDAVLLFNGSEESSNFLYMTGFTSGVFEGTPLLLLRDRMVIFSSVLEYSIAVEQASMRGNMKVERVTSRTGLVSKIRKFTYGKRVGFDGDYLPFGTYMHLKALAKAKALVNISDRFHMLRGIKDETEIRYIKEAVHIVKSAFSGIPTYFRAGMSEKELSARFNYLMEQAGADAQSFKTIVCFGKNSAMPHHSPDSTRLRENSLVLIDAGAKYRNYCSDMTRTFIYKPDKGSAKYRRMADIYNTVKMAQEKALEGARPGIEGSSVHKIAQDYIDRAHKGVYKGRFIHSLGHSIGIDVHDDNKIGFSPSVSVKLKEGMVISDEPGIYIDGFGGVRLEDDVLIKKDGAVFL